MKNPKVNNLHNHWLHAGLTVTFIVALPSASFAQKTDSPATRTLEITPAGSVVEFTLGEFTEKRVLSDGDGDGWCDLWCAMFPEIKHRNKTTDSDGDGLTDYQEMVLMRNAMVEGPMPRKLTDEEIAEGKRHAEEAAVKRAETQLAKRELLLPLMQKGSLPLTEIERRQKLLQFQKIGKDKAEKDREKALKWMRDNNYSIDTPQRIDIDRLDNGVPAFKAGFNAGAAQQLNTDDVQPGGVTGFNLDGQGFSMGIWDEGNLGQHAELAGRFTDQDGDVSGGGVISHSNGVAGTMIASGVNSSAKGMSTAATLDSWDFFTDFAEITNAAVAGMELSNHSYGRLTGWVAQGQTFDFGAGPAHVWFGDISLRPPGVTAYESQFFGLYTQGSRETDQLIYQSPEFLQVWAAGNDRNQPQPINSSTPFYTFNNGQVVFVTGQISADGAANNGFDTISEDQIAKNVISVGAIDQFGSISSFTGFGPTDDGRIKPDVVAKGVNVFTSFTTNTFSYQSVNGTSFASPAVTGSINLLRELRSELDRNPMLASTQKALVIHTASDLGNTGPDYQNGWGLMNTQAAAELIDSDAASDSLPHLKEVFLPDGEFIEFKVKAAGTEPLKVSICWTDPAGTPVPGLVLDPTSKMLVNDLDLRISQGVSVFQPWILNPAIPATAAAVGDNSTDNVEQVLINNPTAGNEYTIKVNHKGSLVDDQGVAFGQMVSILISGNQVEDAPPLDIFQVDQTASDEFTLQFESVVGAQYQLETSTDLVTFTSVGSPVNAIRELVVEPTAAPSTDAKRFWRTVRLDD